jgi:DNA-binding CsgD family transcriptional regulator
MKSFGLTLREIEILHWVKTGKTNGEISNILSISPSTVKNHLYRLFKKLEVSNRMQAIVKLIAAKEKF